jgi:predicted PurR-regulated permease PerM
MGPERLVLFRTRTILKILFVALAVFAAIELISIARQVITWILIAIFLALALNPAVEFFIRRGIRRRAVAIGVTYLLLLSAIAALGGTFIPILVDEVNDFADAVPGYVDDLTAGRGRLGFLERDYHIVERIQDSISEGGAGRILGFSGAAISITKGVITIVIATITIAVLTFFMLLEGPTWIDRFYALLPEDARLRWRNVGYQIYRTVGGFVSGALVIALVAGVSAAILLSILGVPYAIALGLVVALLDLIPLAGATIATLVIATIAFLTSSVVVGVVVLVYFVVYQQIENHVIYPTIYSRTVQLSPLAILIAVLIGASLAGILGALVAIPVAGAIQVVLIDYLRHRAGPPIPAVEGTEST